MNHVNHRCLFGLISIALAVLVSSIIETAAWAQQANRVPVLIGFNRQPGPAEEAIVRRAGGSIKYTYHLVPGIAASLPENAIDALRRNPNITTIEPDGLFHNASERAPSTQPATRVSTSK
jgi:subtilisin